MLTTETEIRDRFLLCINELSETLDEIADKIGTYKSYLSALKKSESPKISAFLVAKFCIEYGYNAHWIITGQGTKKYKEKFKMTKEDKLIKIIEDLLGALLEIRPNWNDTTKQLVNEAKKRVQ